MRRGRVIKQEFLTGVSRFTDSPLEWDGAKPVVTVGGGKVPGEKSRSTNGLRKCNWKGEGKERKNFPGRQRAYSKLVLRNGK